MYHCEYTGAMCGSYAISQAVNENITAAIELCSGVPFGVSSMKDQYGYSRILTVYRDFNASIDETAPLFGIKIQRLDFDNPEDFVRLLESMTEDEKFILGPVNMSYLKYLPLYMQYKAADHYLTFLKFNGSLFISDSEGVPLRAVSSPEELLLMLSIKDIPESSGKFTVRKILSYSKDRIHSEEIRRHTLSMAIKNFYEAEVSGNGSKSFEVIDEVLHNVHAVKWSVSLYISIGNYIQRKIIAGEFFESFGEVSAYFKQAVFEAGYIRMLIRNKQYKGISEWLLKLSQTEKITASLIAKMEDINL